MPLSAPRMLSQLGLLLAALSLAPTRACSPAPARRFSLTPAELCAVPPGGWTRATVFRLKAVRLAHARGRADFSTGWFSDTLLTTIALRMRAPEVTAGLVSLSEAGLGQARWRLDGLEPALIAAWELVRVTGSDAERRAARQALLSLAQLGFARPPEAGPLALQSFQGPWILWRPAPELRAMFERLIEQLSLGGAPSMLGLLRAADSCLSAGDQLCSEDASSLAFNEDPIVGYLEERSGRGCLLGAGDLWLGRRSCPGGSPWPPSRRSAALDSVELWELGDCPQAAAARPPAPRRARDIFGPKVRAALGRGALGHALWRSMWNAEHSWERARRRSIAARRVQLLLEKQARIDAREASALCRPPPARAQLREFDAELKRLRGLEAEVQATHRARERWLGRKLWAP